MSISLLVQELWQFSFIRNWLEIRKSEITPPAILGLKLKQIKKQKEKMELILYFIIKLKVLWNYIQLKNCESVYISLTSCFQGRRGLKDSSKSSFANFLNGTCMILHIQIYLAYSPFKIIKVTICFMDRVWVREGNCLRIDLILLKCASLCLNCTHALLFRNIFWLNFQSFWTTGIDKWSSAICQKVTPARDKNQQFNFLKNLSKGFFWTFRVLNEKLHFAPCRTNETFFGARIRNF